MATDLTDSTYLGDCDRCEREWVEICGNCDECIAHCCTGFCEADWSSDDATRREDWEDN